MTTYRNTGSAPWENPDGGQCWPDGPDVEVHSEWAPAFRSLVDAGVATPVGASVLPQPPLAAAVESEPVADAVAASEPAPEPSPLKDSAPAGSGVGDDELAAYTVAQVDTFLDEFPDEAHRVRALELQREHPRKGVLDLLDDYAQEG